MESFTFVNHTVRHTYPAAPQVSLGSGYSFAVEQQQPVQRMFTLEFEAMRWIKTAQGVFTDTVDPANNIYALLKFYERNRMVKRFLYAHDLFGSLVVRFMTPLELPKTRYGGSGWSEPFTVGLIEQP